MTRPDGRAADALRTVRFTRGWLDHAEGSVLVEFGATRVLCAASVAEEVPRWRRGSGLGWVTAEYAMLPRATNTRNDRESVKGRIGGRTHEISRLVGRSLRACVDYKALGENTITIDCDVLQADGGTRTAAITGGYVALADAISWLRGRGRLKGNPLVASVAAVCVGIVDGEPRLDLCYEEDSAAETDMNVVCTGAGDFVEVQGTAEREPFSRAMLGALLDLGSGGLRRADPAAGGRPLAADLASVLAALRCRRPLRGSCSRRATRTRSPSCPGSWPTPGCRVARRAGRIPRGAGGAGDRLHVRRQRAAEGPRGGAFTGLPAVADDSGLCVDALHGMPGHLLGPLGGPPRRRRPTWGCCSASWPTCPSAARSSSAWPRWRCPDGGAGVDRDRRAAGR